MKHTRTKPPFGCRVYRFVTNRTFHRYNSTGNGRLHFSELSLDSERGMEFENDFKPNPDSIQDQLKMALYEDKLKGMLVGAAVGDALGVPHEFKYQSKIAYTGSLQRGLIRRRYNATKYYLSIGQVSDDTEMTRILADHICKFKSIEVDHLLKAYMTWANHKTSVFRGKHITELFKGIKTVGGIKSRQSRFNTPDKQSNGGLMRCSPAFVLNSSIPYDTAITNPGPIPMQCTQVYHDLLNLLFIQTPISEIEEYLRSKTEVDYQVRAAIVDAIHNSSRDIVTMKGLCTHGLYCAIRGLFHFTDYKSAIDSTILLKGDTDTNACITGALLGIHYGFTAIRAQIPTTVDAILRCTTEDSSFSRPSEYTVAGWDLDRAAKFLHYVYKRNHPPIVPHEVIQVPDTIVSITPPPKTLLSTPVHVPTVPPTPPSTPVPLAKLECVPSVLTGAIPLKPVHAPSEMFIPKLPLVSLEMIMAKHPPVSESVKLKLQQLKFNPVLIPPIPLIPPDGC